MALYTCPLYIALVDLADFSCDKQLYLDTLEISDPNTKVHTGSFANQVEFDHFVSLWTLGDLHFAIAQFLFDSSILIYVSKPSAMAIGSLLDPPNLGEVKFVAGNVPASFLVLAFVILRVLTAIAGFVIAIIITTVNWGASWTVSWTASWTASWAAGGVVSVKNVIIADQRPITGPPWELSHHNCSLFRNNRSCNIQRRFWLKGLDLF